MRVAILGFGLIGGSVARALHQGPTSRSWQVTAWSPSGHGPAAALAEGVIAVAADRPAAAIADADLIVLAAPATECLGLLDQLAGPWATAMRPGAVVTDVASTKAAVLDRARSLGLRYVGGHPMAGLETSGYDAAVPGLFEGRPWVVVPGDAAAIGDAAAVAAVTALAEACGARPVVMTAAAHDAAVAGISHLPLVLSAALVEAVAGAPHGPARDDWPDAAALAAGSWRDMTRVARGDPAMGAAIAATNAPAIAARLHDLRDAIDSWLEALERPGGPDEGAIEARLRSARARLEPPTDG